METRHAQDPRPWLVIDSIEPRVIGGLIIDWLQNAAPAGGFRIRGSNGGRRWKTLYAATKAGGKRSYVYLPGLEARFLRLEIDEPSAGAAVHVQSFGSRAPISMPSGTTSPDAEARGYWHPRWLHNEQSVWTPFGIVKRQSLRADE